MAIVVLILFASAVLTVLFWATVFAVALAILHLLLSIVQGIFWLVTRPVVWLVIMPLRYVFGGSQKPSPVIRQGSGLINSATGSSTDKLQQLTKLKNLVDCGTITTAEFEQLKADLFRLS